MPSLKWTSKDGLPGDRLRALMPLAGICHAHIRSYRDGSEAWPRLHAGVTIPWPACRMKAAFKPDIASMDPRILLIDDMPSIHEDFRRILTPPRTSRSLIEAEGTLFSAAAALAPGFSLDCTGSGEDGLALLHRALDSRQPYALAFVDMRMPSGWDGVRTIEELWRADAALQVVICTAYSDYPLERALVRLDSQDRLLVLKKPFDPIEVQQLARALTAKHRLALEAASHLAHLEQVLVEVRQAGAEMRGRNDELEELARGVSLGMRSPIETIGMFTDLLGHELDGQGGERVAAYLARLRASARHGEELIQGVLALTDIARAGMTAELLDLSRIAREVIERQRAANPGRGVSASVQDGLRAWGDRGLVTELLEHLLDNAWKFTRHQATAAITVGAHRGMEGERVFYVSDSGCGFDPALAGNLFRRFVRLHPPGEHPGAGVGLVAVGRIVQRHGGRVWADSRPGQSTTIYFTLPSAGGQPPRDSHAGR